MFTRSAGLLTAKGRDRLGRSRGRSAIGLLALAACASRSVPVETTDVDSAQAPRTQQTLAMGARRLCAIVGPGQKIGCIGPAGENTLPGSAGARRVATNDEATCATFDDGALRCWDWRTGGAHDEPRTYTLEGADGAVKLDLFAATFAARLGPTFRILTPCILSGAGQVRCWRIENGAAGSATTFQDLHSIQDIDFIGLRLCAVRRSGQVACFDPPAEHGVIPVPGIADATRIAGGPQSMCVLHDAGGVSCRIQRGVPERWDWHEWHAIPGPTHAVELFSGDGYTYGADGGLTIRMCILNADGEVQCWRDHRESGPHSHYEDHELAPSPIDVQRIELGDAARADFVQLYGATVCHRYRNAVRCRGARHRPWSEDTDSVVFTPKDFRARRPTLGGAR